MFFIKVKDRLILNAKKNGIFSVTLLFLIFIFTSQLIDVAPARFEKPNFMDLIESIFEMYAAMALFTINNILKEKTSKNKNLNLI